MRSSGHRLPWLKIAEMLGLWVAFLVMQALKSRWQRCSLPFILMYSVQGVFCVVTGILFLWQARSLTSDRVRQTPPDAKRRNILSPRDGRVQPGRDSVKLTA